MAVDVGFSGGELAHRIVKFLHKGNVTGHHSTSVSRVLLVIAKKKKKIAEMDHTPMEINH